MEDIRKMALLKVTFKNSGSNLTGKVKVKGLVRWRQVEFRCCSAGLRPKAKKNTVFAKWREKWICKLEKNMEVLVDPKVIVLCATLGVSLCFLILVFLCLKIKTTKKTPELIGTVGTVKPLDNEANSPLPSFKGTYISIIIASVQFLTFRQCYKS